MEKFKCFTKNHGELKVISFCKECKVYMCNLCENYHSKFCKDHHLNILETNSEEIFTGFCAEESHENKLEYYCTDHNQLVCASCITKIKGKGNGQHSECYVCFIEDIKESKKNKLPENIKSLEDLSKTFQQSMNELKKIFANINNNKGELQSNIQNIFLKIRNELISREQEILLEIDKIFNKLYFDESLIKKGEKLANQININISKGEITDSDWNDDCKLKSNIYTCINIENNIKDINEINQKIKKINSLEIEPKFISQDEINNYIENIKSFFKIIWINRYNYEDTLENNFKKSKIIENEEQIKNLKSWLPYPNKDNLRCKLIYHAKRDGDSAETFHSLCDNKGATLTIIYTSDNKKIGGFLMKSFGGNRGSISDNNSFLFSLNYNEKYPSVNGEGFNYNDQRTKGPIFGNTCIYISNNFLSSKYNFYRPNTCRYDFGQRNKYNKKFYFTVLDLEVYQIIEY